MKAEIRNVTKETKEYWTFWRRFKIWSKVGVWIKLRKPA